MRQLLIVDLDVALRRRDRRMTEEDLHRAEIPGAVGFRREVMPQTMRGPLTSERTLQPFPDRVRLHVPAERARERPAVAVKQLHREIRRYRHPSFLATFADDSEPPSVASPLHLIGMHRREFGAA